MRRKILSILLIACLLFATIPQRADAKVRLVPEERTIKVGQKFKIKIKGTKEKAEWSTTNKKIASVNKKGVVKGKKEGYVNIRANVGWNSLVCLVIVEKKSKKIKDIKNINYYRVYPLGYALFLCKKLRQLKDTVFFIANFRGCR